MLAYCFCNPVSLFLCSDGLLVNPATQGVDSDCGSASDASNPSLGSQDAEQPDDESSSERSVDWGDESSSSESSSSEEEGEHPSLSKTNKLLKKAGNSPAHQILNDDEYQSFLNWQLGVRSEGYCGADAWVDAVTLWRKKKLTKIAEEKRANAAEAEAKAKSEAETKAKQANKKEKRYSEIVRDSKKAKKLVLKKPAEKPAARKPVAVRKETTDPSEEERKPMVCSVAGCGQELWAFDPRCRGTCAMAGGRCHDHIHDVNFDCPCTKTKEVDPKLAEFAKQFAPMTADLCKKRKQKLTPPPKGKGPTKAQGARKSDVSPQTIKQRIRDFPSHELVIEAGQLFCRACKCRVGSAKGATQKHIETKKHIDALKDLRKKTDEQDVLSRYITEYEDSAKKATGCNLKGSTVDAEDKLFRAEAVDEFALSGTPQAKIDRLRSFLERRAGRTLARSDELLSQFLPPLVLKEVEMIRAEVKDQMVGLYFDETTHEGESFCIIIRYVDTDINIRLRAIRVRFLAGTPSANEIAAVLIDTVTNDGHIRLDDVLAIMCDGAAANLSAYSGTMESACPSSDLELCMPHTSGHVWTSLNTPNLDEFLKGWSEAFKHSLRAKELFKKICGVAPKKKGQGARWWIKLDIISESMYPFLEDGRLLRWVRACIAANLSPQAFAKMLHYLTDPAARTLLWLETAVSRHIGVPFKARLPPHIA